MMSWSQEKFYMVFGLELKKKRTFSFHSTYSILTKAHTEITIQ